MDVRGREAEALGHLENAVRIQPESTEAQVNLGIALADVPSRLHDAIAHLELAVKARPDLPVRELLEQLKADAKAKAR